MSKFKAGDKVLRICDPVGHGAANGFPTGAVGVVSSVTPAGVAIRGVASFHGQRYLELVEAAPTTGEPVYAGHHSDGSSIQKHSAGPLYPYVIVYRDKKGGPDEFGKYDVGVIGPKHEGTIWCKDFNQAVALAEHLKDSTA